MNVSEWKALTEEDREQLLARPAAESDRAIRDSVADIISNVRKRGDDALYDYCREFDKTNLASLKVDDDERTWAETQLDDDAIAAIDLAISNVRAFHSAQMPQTIDVETMPGVHCQRISQPLDAVGLYVPAGSAPLPSAAIMLAVPAQIADCPVRVLCTPPRPDGKADPAVIVAATRAGIDTIFKIGGAQAIAAMAYGTESVPKTNKIFGPGNTWVTCAKSLVSSDADGAAIDMPAGPSEVLVIADETANPEFVASDLLAQAEHGPDSQVILVTTSGAIAAAVQTQIDDQLKTLSRADIASAALDNSRSIVVETIETAIKVSNRYAPEHLIIQTAEPRTLLDSVRNAGSVFVGQWTPESVGDYCSGTNHVLPTYGYARNYSGLGLDQFMRQMTVQELDRDGLQSLGDTVVQLAGLEGLDAHAAAVTRRLAGSS